MNEIVIAGRYNRLSGLIVSFFWYLSGPVKLIVVTKYSFVIVNYYKSFSCLDLFSHGGEIIMGTTVVPSLRWYHRNFGRTTLSRIYIII